MRMHSAHGGRRHCRKRALSCRKWGLSNWRGQTTHSVYEYSTRISLQCSGPARHRVRLRAWQSNPWGAGVDRVERRLGVLRLAVCVAACRRIPGLRRKLRLGGA